MRLSAAASLCLAIGIAILVLASATPTMAPVESNFERAAAFEGVAADTPTTRTVTHTRDVARDHSVRVEVAAADTTLRDPLR